MIEISIKFLSQFKIDHDIRKGLISLIYYKLFLRYFELI